MTAVKQATCSKCGPREVDVTLQWNYAAFMVHYLYRNMTKRTRRKCVCVCVCVCMYNSGKPQEELKSSLATVVEYVPDWLHYYSHL